jgi:hypothetical protein
MTNRRCKPDRVAIGFRPRRDGDVDLENNKRTVVEFYELAFNGKQPEQAVEKYLVRSTCSTTRRPPTARRRSSGS